MSENSTKIKLLKLYEILRSETDEEHPISRVELAERVHQQGASLAMSARSAAI